MANDENHIDDDDELDLDRMQEGRDYVFYKNARQADPERKEQAWLYLAEGKSLREVSKLTGFNPGTLSKWRRSPNFARWVADHGGVPYVPMVKEKRRGRKPKKRDRSQALEIKGKFMQAVSVGGLAWAQQYAGANDAETAKFLRDLAVSEANAKPRVKVLAEMLQLGLDPHVSPNTRIKALADWWRLAENVIGGGPLVHIDARGVGAEPQKETPTQRLLAAMREQLADAAAIDLTVDGESIDIIDHQEADDDSTADDE